MNAFFDVDAILDAAGLSPDIPNAQEVARKIFNDGLVQLRAQTLATESFIVEAVRQLTNPERDALKKRTGIVVEKIKQPVAWSLVPPEQNVCNVARIVATCGAETVQFSGSVASAKAFRWKGEAIPAEILYLYELQLPLDANTRSALATELHDRKLRAQEALTAQNQLTPIEKEGLAQMRRQEEEFAARHRND